MIFKHLKDITIYFSAWTRKSYAAFNSIGKEVMISVLDFDLHKEQFDIFYLSNKNQYQILNLNIIELRSISLISISKELNNKIDNYKSVN